MITIYHLGVSQSDRIVWLCEELNVPYRVEWFDRGPDGLAPPEYLSLHPVATAPVIRDGDLVLSESVAIVEYISHKYGGGSLSVAPSEPNYPQYMFWMQFNNNLLGCFFAKLAGGQHLDPASSIAKTLSRRENDYFAYLEQCLGEADYLAGDKFSCADIMSVFPLVNLPAHLGRSFDASPNTRAYIERITQRPAYAKAMSVAGPGASRPA